MQDRPTTPRFSDDGILGPRIAPASPPTRSTRLAAQRRRKRCGSGMGSRVLMRLSPHKPLSGWPRTLFAKVKQQRRGFTGFFEVGGWTTFSGNRGQKGGSFPLKDFNHHARAFLAYWHKQPYVARRQDDLMSLRKSVGRLYGIVNDMERAVAGDE